MEVGNGMGRDRWGFNFQGLFLVFFFFFHLVCVFVCLFVTFKLVVSRWKDLVLHHIVSCLFIQ